MMRHQICKVCGKLKQYYAKGMCEKCYQKQQERRIIRCIECGKLKEHSAHGLCRKCYRRQHKSSLRKCPVCGELKEHQAKGMCKSCYQKQYQKQYTPPLIECSICGKLKPYLAKGMCANCYMKQHIYPIIKCSVCDELRPHRAKGMCRSCYEKQYKKTESGKEAHRRFNKSEKARMNSRKTQSKRHRDLGYELLFDNPFNAKVDYHHISDAFVLSIPKELHQMYNGIGTEIHRKRLKPIIEELYDIWYMVIEKNAPTLDGWL